MRGLLLLAYSSVEKLMLRVQVAYLSKKLQAAKADFAAADEARRALAQRDREAAAAMADMHRDMAGHVVRCLPDSPASACNDMLCIRSDHFNKGGLSLQLMAFRALQDAMHHKHYLRFAP